MILQILLIYSEDDIIKVCNFRLVKQERKSKYKGLNNRNNEDIYIN